MKLIIFGGTSEGRELAEWAAGNNIFVILCVATDYGGMVCGADDHISVSKGRLDADEMCDLFDRERPELIVDATHPHAVSVSANISLAAKKSGLPLIRIIRPRTDIPAEDRYKEWAKDSLISVSCAGEALNYLKQNNEPILLTTGSKELSELSSLPGFEERVYARVLPDADAILNCEKAGLKGAHIIAMQGPFSTDLNLALIRYTGAKWMVTKESGKRGGFSEKIEAAADAGIRMIVIGRPSDEEGLGLEEAEEEILKMRGEQDEPPDKGTDLPDITLIGLGMGGLSQLTIEAADTLESARLVFGSARMIKDIGPFISDKELIPLYKPGDIFPFLDEHPEFKSACVLFSGDTGFYSGAADFPTGPNIHILPGISSFSCLCARFGLKEEEFYPASAHGKDPDTASLLAAHEKVFLLLDPKTTVSSVCRELVKAGYADAFIYAGARLGYKDERLFRGKAEDLCDTENDALAVMAVERDSKDNA